MFCTIAGWSQPLLHASTGCISMYLVCTCPARARAGLTIATCIQLYVPHMFALPAGLTVASCFTVPSSTCHVRICYRFDHCHMPLCTYISTCRAFHALVTDQPDHYLFRRIFVATCSLFMVIVHNCTHHAYLSVGELTPHTSTWICWGFMVDVLGG